MSEWRLIRNANTGAVVLPYAKLCVDFWSHFKGLQLVPRLPDDEGLLFVARGENRTETAIHMLFMRFSIGVVWVSSGGQVVDTAYAKPWRLYYAPRKAAKYFIEANPTLLERVSVGDILRFEETAPPQR